jgi:hypothetical protein
MQGLEGNTGSNPVGVAILVFLHLTGYVSLVVANVSA